MECKREFANTPELVLPQGNYVKLKIPLTLKTVSVVEGNVVLNESEYIPCLDYPIFVEFQNLPKVFKFKAYFCDGKVVVEDKGTLLPGVYDFVVGCKDIYGNPLKFKKNSAIKIVETSEEFEASGISEMEVRYLEASTFYSIGPEGGRGIDHFETIQEEGKVKVICHLLDGTTREFEIPTGSQFVVDKDWDLESDNALANRVVTSFRNDVIESLNKKSTIVDETLTIEW